MSTSPDSCLSYVETKVDTCLVDMFTDSQLSTALMLENENAGIRKDIGLAHGDKIHVDDKDNGENSVLAKLFEQVQSCLEKQSATCTCFILTILLL